MNRRQFLSPTAAVSGALSLPSSLGAAEGVPPHPDRFSRRHYSHGPDKIKLAMTSPGWEFVGVCDSTDSGRATCAKLGAKLISQEELFQRAEVVAVESEVRDHAAHALLALQAGKHVHLEKPPATRAPLEPPTLSVHLVNPAGPYAQGAQRVPLPAYQRYVHYVFANSAGPQGGGKWSAGDSKIVAPDGAFLRLADNRRAQVLVEDLDLSRATRKHALDSLRHPRFLASHWRRILPDLRQRGRKADHMFRRWIASPDRATVS